MEVAAPSDDAGKDEGGLNGVAVAGFAVAFPLVELHVGGVVATRCGADRRTDTVVEGDFVQILEAGEAVGREESSLVSLAFRSSGVSFIGSSIVKRTRIALVGAKRR